MRLRFLQWDLLGISVSLLCAVHCVVLPLALSSLSILGGPLLHNRWLEGGIIACSFVIGLMAFYKGCFVQHKAKWPLLLFTAGFALLLINQWNEQNAFYLIPAATVLMVSAHYINYRRCQQSCSLQTQKEKIN